MAAELTTDELPDIAHRLRCVQIHHSDLEPPAHLADVQRDARGYIIPAETPWVGDVPYLSRYDTARTLALAAARACAVCGLPLLADHPVWRAFSQGDAALARADDPNTDELGAPRHESCMLYSTLVCPFWRTPQSRLGKDSLRAPGAKRGTRPAVLGYNDINLLVEPGRDLLRTEPPPFRFLYVGRIADVRFTNPHEDLVNRYHQALDRDARAVDAKSRRFYWGGDPAARDDLMSYLGTAVPPMLMRRLGLVLGHGTRYESLQLLHDDS